MDQDTSDSEPYMVLHAIGFESDEEIVQTLKDLALSIDTAARNVQEPVEPHNHQPVQHRDGMPPWCDDCGLTATYQHPVSPLLDQETRERAIREFNLTEPEPVHDGFEPTHVSFNPQPRKTPGT
jgi:hypothetical protein